MWKIVKIMMMMFMKMLMKKVTFALWLSLNGQFNNESSLTVIVSTL